MFHDIIIMAPPSEHVFKIIYALITPFATIGIICVVFILFFTRSLCSQLYSISVVYFVVLYNIYKYICKKNECVYQPFLPNVT